MEDLFKKKKIQAVELYGEDTVYEVVQMVRVADADGAYSLFEEQGMGDHAECVEFLYFNN